MSPDYVDSFVFYTYMNKHDILVERRRRNECHAGDSMRAILA